MTMHVVEAMCVYGEIGYDSFEVPDVTSGQTLFVAYKPELMQDDYVIDAICSMPGSLDDGVEADWAGGVARLAGYEMFFQGSDALYLDMLIAGAGGWECVMQCVAPKTENPLTFQEMLDIMREELVELGIM